jgi:bifunctional NMN adenylyltransferase/nudix hydrolase
MSDGHTLSVCIGDFALASQSDLHVLRQGLAQAPRCLVLIAPAYQARSSRHPFTWEQRAGLIRAMLGQAAGERVSIEPLRERYDAVRGRQDLQHAIARHGAGGSVTVLRTDPRDSESLLASLFSAGNPQAAMAAVESQVPASTQAWLSEWLRSPQYPHLREEWQQIAFEKKAWSVAPYPVVLVTVDVVVRACGHVLLVTRGRQPGKGLRALPGGFLDPRESVYDCAVRELAEETQFELDEGEMRSALRGVQVFDHPQRSQRGRVITHAHYFDLGDRPLSRVEGSDDAAAAQWVPIARLVAMEAQFLDDHFHILDRFLQLDQKNTL